MITLDGGQTALWLGVFTSQRPVTGTALMPLVIGDHTDDQPAARIDAFEPVKLANTGTLLLRSTVDVAGRRLEGLLSLDGLFDWRRS